MEKVCRISIIIKDLAFAPERIEKFQRKYKIIPENKKIDFKKY